MPIFDEKISESNDLAEELRIAEPGGADQLLAIRAGAGAVYIQVAASAPVRVDRERATRLARFLAAEQFQTWQRAIVELETELATPAQECEPAWTIVSDSEEYLLDGYEQGRVEPVDLLPGQPYLVFVNKRPQVAKATGQEGAKFFRLRLARVRSGGPSGALVEIGAVRVPAIGDYYWFNSDWVCAMPGDAEPGRQPIYRPLTDDPASTELARLAEENLLLRETLARIIHGDNQHRRGPRELAIDALRRADSERGLAAQHLVDLIRSSSSAEQIVAAVDELLTLGEPRLNEKH